MQVISIAKVLLRRTSDGRYLILRSSEWEERPDRSLRPDLPGGMVEVGETTLEGATRELTEEAGVKLSPHDLKLVQAESFISTKKGAITRLIYLAELGNEPDIKLSWEHDKYWWMSADEVMALDIRDPYPEIFHYLQEIGILV